ncbi:response regulator [Rickettsiales bacterium]|nr:response regulator [Rickettsiales bacterium]
MDRFDYEDDNIVFPFKDVQVLVAEDDPIMSRLINSILTSFGFKKIFITHYGDKALDMARENAYGLIILDWELKGISGVDLTKAIRADKNSPSRLSHIIMATGKNSIEEVQQARDSGITEFILKPFTVNEFRDKIVSVLEKPRNFIISNGYTGPDRRRKTTFVPVNKERRKDQKERYTKMMQEQRDNRNKPEDEKEEEKNENEDIVKILANSGITYTDDLDINDLLGKDV